MSPSTIASSTTTSHHHSNLHNSNNPHGNDVRKYITIKPIPLWKEAKDSKLVARNFKHYTLDYPTREQVFKDNYARRKSQMHAQGYHSVPWRPYKEVGCPIYLNTKELVQTSLGQKEFENEKGNTRGDGKEKSEADGQTKKSRKSKNKKMSTATFVMKHKQQSDLQSIDRDRKYVQETMLNVKMGHALFPMLEEDKNRNDSAFLVDKQNQLIQAQYDVRIQPVSTDELTNKEDIDLKLKYAAKVHHRRSLRSQSSRASLMSTSSSHGSARMVAKKPEVVEQARPFTPVHSNISHKIKDDENIYSRIWKQLCALHWIYVASTLNISKDNKMKRMNPICECWSEVEPGGKIVDARSFRQEQRNNENWRKFKDNTTKKISRSRSRRKGFSSSMKRNSSYASNLSGYQGYQGSSGYQGYQGSSGYQGYQGSNYLTTSAMKPNSSIASNLSGYDGGRANRPSSARSGIMKLQQRNNSIDLGASLDSFDGIPPRPSSPGQSSVTTTIVGGTVAGSEFGDDDNATEAGFSVTEVDHKDEENHEQLQKLLSTVATSVHNEMQSREKAAERIAKQNKILPLSVYDWSRNNYCIIKNKEVSISKNMILSETNFTDFKENVKEKPTQNVRLRPHSAAVHNRRSSIMQHSRPSTAAMTLGLKVNKRPQSSPAKLTTFQFRFSSEDKAKNLGQIREDFNGVNDTKALQLHNLLTELEKRRKQRMEKKFEIFSVSSSMHRDLEGMRIKSQTEMIKDQNNKKKRAGVLPCDWFNILNSNLPPSIHEDPNCDIILQKLGNVVITNPYPITPDAFLGALSGLKPWELCAPDVSAAIEFIREKVVGMPAKQFDEWRTEQITQRKVIIGADSSTTPRKLSVKM